MLYDEKNARTKTEFMKCGYKTVCMKDQDGKLGDIKRCSSVRGLIVFKDFIFLILIYKYKTLTKWYQNKLESKSKQN